MGRLTDTVAIVVGAGQTPGETVGNGRATALLFAREGARVLAVDRDLTSAQETADLIIADGGEAAAVRADVTVEADIEAAVAAAMATWGRIDILHNNVGVSLTGGDAPVTDIEGDAFARLIAINLGGMVLAIKHVLPVMRRQGGGVIINISSNAVLVDYPYVAYKTSKAGVVALTENVAITNAAYGIRANVILPGLMDTPMAVERHVGVGGASRDAVVAERTARTPLARGGTAWDVANAALFLASDDAAFITGASLVVDGGQSLATGGAWTGPARPANVPRDEGRPATSLDVPA
ncbi:MAG: 3-oxoacyl-ACP reductase [Pseudarthrobacter sp.]|nr:3-oxoacyl-ACP reductase [Pseudarthrobacter sp.]